ncbi:hypothetical protein G6011_01065 [Alternaria panax]|uniref:Uncharacterized protein n=1 Tax=Alternaria panax TaxID=48097 RepID=A0AAD4IK19_9PLEO|nr:hypothetical protein G6011_01065 [Alternaria panax]
MSIAHCIFYPNLKGQVVGKADQQEEKIRFGTGFAFIAQICLGTSVWTAYTQWLWRTLMKKDLTFKVLNSAFAAENSVLSLLNIEMWKRLKVGSIMAFLAWGLLIPPFFTPATLFIYESTDVEDVIVAMPRPSIANASAAHRFAYSPPSQPGTTQYETDVNRIFTCPRTVMNLLATATSSLGEILPLDLPYNNSAYSVDFYAPIVRCAEANETEQYKIDGLLKEEMNVPHGTLNETAVAYFGFVPTYNSSRDLIAVSQPRQQMPSKPMNELWMTFLRPEIDDQGKRVKTRHYQICRPHNASYSLEISQYHGVQNVSSKYEVGEAIPFPNERPHEISNMTQHAYTAFMWVVCDQLVGKLAWWTDTSIEDEQQAAAQFGIIDSPIQRTSLLGSSDLDAYFEFDEERGLYKDQNISTAFDLSDQRLQDKAMARNRTLDVLIEELSFNLTVSMMHNRLLTDMVDTTVQLTTDVNRYDYKSYSLFLPYALANVFTLICVVLGLTSYVRDGAMPGKKMQDLVHAARNPNSNDRPALLSRTTSLGAGFGPDGAIVLRIATEDAGERSSDARVGASRDGNWSGDVEKLKGNVFV